MEWVSSYIGIPWEKMDCWALSKEILSRHFDILIEGPEYNPTDSGDIQWSLVNRYRKDWIKTQRASTGDLVLFTFYMGRPHMGVCLNSSEFVHSTRYAGVCIERFSSPRWHRRIEGFYRYSPSSSS